MDSQIALELPASLPPAAAPVEPDPVVWLPRRTLFARCLGDLLFYFVISIVVGVPLAMAAIATAISPGNGASMPPMPPLIIVLMLVFGVVAFGGVAWYRMGEEMRTCNLVALGDRPARGWWRWLAAACACVAVFDTAYFCLLHAVHLDRFAHNPVMDMLSKMSGWSLWAAMATAVLLAPVAEEMFFRGTMFGRFRARGYAVSGAVISALMFAALHGVPALLPVPFVLGLATAWVYHKSGSLWPAMALHILNNGVAVVAFLIAGTR